MRCLITTVKQSIKGGESRRQRSEDVSEFTIGRGSNQVLRVADLRVAIEHSRISLITPGRYKIEALTPGGVMVDGKRAQLALIKPGAVLRIGDTEIRVMAVDDDHDICVEIHQLPSTAVATAKIASGAIFAAFPISKRRLSWLLFALVLLMGLGLPLAGYFNPNLREPLRSTFPGGDNAWLSGDLSSAHQYFGADCNTCHVEAFKPAPDTSCESCHANTQPHAANAHSRMPALEADQCESCHKEHNGDDGFIPARQAFCTDCHSEIGGSGSASELVSISDFGTDHPQFKASLIRVAFDENSVLQTSVDRVALDDSEISEQSNLLFPHDLHLDPAGLESPEAQQPVVMECADCHRPDVSAALMQPVNFIQHCQQCHQLNFDPSNPDRIVPHGKPGEIVDLLTEFYSDLALRGASNEVDIQPLQSSDPGEILFWARVQATRTASTLFEDRACGTCHQVQRKEFANRTEWQVLPARVSGSWFPQANFTHGRHTAMECVDCHAAPSSAESNDVLMPDLASCRDCHGGERAENKLQSTCIACHKFHSPRPQPALRLSSFNRKDFFAPGDTPSGTLYLRDRPDMEAAARQREEPATRRRRPGAGP